MNQFADLEWQSRWNDTTKPWLDLLLSGSKLIVTGPMGILRLDLDKTEDVTAICQKLSSMAGSIAAAKRRHDEIKEQARQEGWL